MTNRLIPEHFNMNGLPKTTYPTLERAERAAWIIDMDVYQCNFCGKWHLGSKED